ncbi:hypothetical protein [Defluviitalea phaphyphila]|uniref:hypothetical protein n=1 Tax=Defluviitalea phaphyphila TaxID=1473580 RepID=UPI000730551B|nr:hypothetical protein [Defluviitalea phaphyphila]
MKKPLKLISILLLFVILSGVFFYMKTNNYAKIINLNWDIKLPNSYKEVYSTDSGANFHGDGEKYHIFEYKNEEEINKALDWIDGKNVQIEAEIDKILNNFDISKKNIPIPDYNKEYKYYTEIKEDNSKIYFLFIPETKMLYIVEDII